MPNFCRISSAVYHLVMFSSDCSGEHGIEMLFAPQGLIAPHYFGNVLVLANLEYPRQIYPELFAQFVVGVELGNRDRGVPQPFLIRLGSIEKFVNILSTNFWMKLFSRQDVMPLFQPSDLGTCNLLNKCFSQ